jgi:hypothetical protein
VCGRYWRCQCRAESLLIVTMLERSGRPRRGSVVDVSVNIVNDPGEEGKEVYRSACVVADCGKCNLDMLLS